MVIIWLALINIVAFVVFGIDKFKAVAGTWRVPERVLIALAVIGGSIGALLGMLIWRHKIRKPKFYITIPVLIIVQALLIFWGYYQNNHLTTSYYDLDIGLGHEMTIVQVSDLHAKVFGRSPEELLDRIGECDPDIIVVTGDAVDGIHPSFKKAEQFFEGAVEIAPVYYISGNHEAMLSESARDDFYEHIENMGVILADDQVFEFDGLTIAAIGDDTLTRAGTPDRFGLFDRFNDEDPVLLLAHEPGFTELYTWLGADLVLTGHIHGGQIIIPGKGGLISPDVEFFPEYYDGLYELGGECNTRMIVSRGIGNSVLPLRINNYPELVVVTVR